MTDLVASFDTETKRFAPRNMAPPLVCLSFLEGGIEGTPDLVTRHDAPDLVRDWMRRGATFLGHTLCFDFAVLSALDPSLIPDIWQAYEDDRVIDVGVDQKLIDIAHGKYGLFRKGKKEFDGGPYSLAGIFHRHTGIALTKDDAIRLTYDRLYDVPLPKWDEEHVQYAKDDAVAPVIIHDAQKVYTPLLEDRYRQVRADWWLRLMSVWGLQTNSKKVAEFRRITEKRIQEIRGDVTRAGLLRLNGTRDTKVAKARMIAACKELGVPVRMTDGGKRNNPQVCLDKEACEESGDDVLEKYAEIGSLNRVVSTDIPWLETGIIHSHFEVIEDTGRTGSSKPNAQNWRRLVGMRECVTARRNRLIIDCDYGMIELRTWSQCCLWMFGYSRLAERLNAGFDPHLDLGADFIGLTYEEAKARKGEKEVKSARQKAKGPNFGLPGGMGPDGLVRYMRTNYRIKITRAEAVRIIAAWTAKWPESTDYFKFIRSQLRWKKNRDDDSVTDVQHFISNRYRGRIWYTKACNTFFQGLAADLAKAVGFELSRRCYDPAHAEKTGSLLYGARLINFVHDQFLIEADRDIAAEAAIEVGRVMCEFSAPFLPDVPATCEPALCEFWSKDVEAVYDSTGALKVWYPEAA